MVSVNLNDKVKIKLSSFGKEVVEQHYAHLKSIPSFGPNYIPRCLEVHEDGYNRFQLWELFEIFGPYIHLGMNEVPFEGNEISWD